MNNATLYDHLGRPLHARALRENQLESRIGQLDHWAYETSEYVRGLTPENLASLLERTAEEYDPVDYVRLAEAVEERYAHYQSVLGVRKRHVSQLPVNVQPADDSKEAARDAELVRAWTQRPAFNDELFDLLSAISIGISVSEIIWDMSEKQWWPERLEWVNPAYLVLDETRRHLRLRATADSHGTELTPGKFVELRIKAKSGLPIRSGLARVACWLWLMHAYGLRGWVQLAEIHGLPIRLGKFDARASREDQRALLRAVSSIGRDAAAIIPESMQMELLTGEARAHAELHQNLMLYLDHTTSKLVLGQTTTTDAISGGHAVSQEHEMVREDIQRADVRAVEGALNGCIVQPLIMLNHGVREHYPRLSFDTSDKLDIEKYLAAAQRAQDMGLRIGARGLRERTELPEPEDKDDALTPREQASAGAAQPAPAPMTRAPQRQRRAAASAHAATLSSEELDRIAEAADAYVYEHGDAAIAPAIEPLIEHLRGAKNYAELRARLEAAAEHMDTEPLQQMLTAAGLAAFARGVDGADPEDE